MNEELYGFWDRYKRDFVIIDEKIRVFKYFSSYNNRDEYLLAFQHLQLVRNIQN